MSAEGAKIELPKALTGWGLGNWCRLSEIKMFCF